MVESLASDPGVGESRIRACGPRRDLPRGLELFLADGLERIVEFAFIPIKDDSGRVLFVDPTGIDVTERAQAEKDSQAAAILESITDGIFAVDRQWRFTYVNRQAERLLGHPADFFLGKVIWEVYPGLVGSEFAQAYHCAAADWVASAVTAYYSDHYRWYETHTYPSNKGVSIYFRDASEQMRAEKKRQELTAAARIAGEKLRHRSFECADLIYTFDLEGRFTYPNRACTPSCRRVRTGGRQELLRSSTTQLNWRPGCSADPGGH